MNFLDFFITCCCGLSVVFSFIFIYYLLILKERGDKKYKQFQDFFKDLAGNKKTKKKVETKSKAKAEEKKPVVEDAEFREIKK